MNWKYNTNVLLLEAPDEFKHLIGTRGGLTDYKYFVTKDGQKIEMDSNKWHIKIMGLTGCIDFGGVNV